MSWTCHPKSSCKQTTASQTIHEILNAAAHVFIYTQGKS